MFYLVYRHVAYVSFDPPPPHPPATPKKEKKKKKKKEKKGLSLNAIIRPAGSGVGWGGGGGGGYRLTVVNTSGSNFTGRWESSLLYPTVT